jgi:hypothetical protein
MILCKVDESGRVLTMSYSQHIVRLNRFHESRIGLTG